MSQMNPTRDDFAALLEESFAQSDLYEGSVVKGKIVAIEKDLAVIDVTDEGFVLRELADGVTQEEVIEKTGAPLKVELTN